MPIANLLDDLIIIAQNILAHKVLRHMLSARFDRNVTDTSSIQAVSRSIFKPSVMLPFVVVVGRADGSLA